MAKNTKVTMAERVLRFIDESPDGRKLGEIQKFIYESNYPHEVGRMVKSTRYNYKTGKSVPCEVPAYRSYWGTNLCGNHRTAGILESFCIKTPDRRYHVVEEIKPPFFRRHGGEMTATYEMNAGKRHFDWQLRQVMAPKCPGCKLPQPYEIEGTWTPEKSAHYVMWSIGGWKADCLGRVWTGSSRQPGLLTSLKKDTVIAFTTALRDLRISSDKVEEIVSRYVLDNVVRT